jgi:wobble nucleotide-excising tRNase
MIKTIKLKGVATYNPGTEISGLTKINFIYGANGSGKTTLSNFIANQEDGKFENCSIEWEQSQDIEALVYNKEFRDKNFGKDSLDGIFTLGQATKEEKDLILQKQEDLDTILKDSKKRKATLDNQNRILLEEEDKFIKWCWENIFKKYKKNFKEAFQGVSGNKTKFKEKLLDEFSSNKEDILSLDKLEDRAKTIFGEIPQSTPAIYNVTFNEILSIETNTIWIEIIIGKSCVDIAKLIQELKLDDWVNHGKNYIQENNICPFCQQETITDDFRSQLESYFDKTFIEAIEEVESLQQKYLQKLESLLNQLEKIEFNQKSNPLSKLDIDKFTTHLKILKGQFISNKELLTSKIKEPSRSIELISTQEQLQSIYELIEEANTEIKVHNDIVMNYKAEKENLISSIWGYIVDNNKIEIKKNKKQLQGLRQGILKIEDGYKEKKNDSKTLNDEIKELNKNVTSIQPTINEINRILTSYGFINFEIVSSKDDPNKYQIRRKNGELAEATLSEGEITFITFLYYLQLTKGAIEKDNVSDNRILVIDDPISSLDSDILFVVSSLIKKIIDKIKNDIGNIKQLIVLTHNVYFHKEVSFIDMRDNGGKHTNYWIVRKNNNISTFTSYKKNPIQTSYQLLWQEIQDKEKNSIVTIQNTMRRIIENYFKILGNYNKVITDKFDDSEEQMICKSLLSWINDGSHGISDDLYIETQDNTIDKYLEVFKQIFIKTDHAGHYNMMMKIENQE